MVDLNVLSFSLEGERPSVKKVTFKQPYCFGRAHSEAILPISIKHDVNYKQRYASSLGADFPDPTLPALED